MLQTVIVTQAVSDLRGVSAPGDVYNNMNACCVVVAEWKQSEVLALLDRIQAVLPNDDNVKYSTMADRLVWDEVKVGQYTPAECKDQWINITTKVTRVTLRDAIQQLLKLKIKISNFKIRYIKDAS